MGSTPARDTRQDKDLRRFELLENCFVREVVQKLTRNDDPVPVAAGTGSISEPFGRLWVSIGGLTGEFAMPHFPKPFFKKARGLWYVEINRQQVNLGPDREAAFRQYH